MKVRISDTWIRKSLQSSAVSAGDEVYDEKEQGLVLRIRKRTRSWYLYEQRGKRKSKLGTWPTLNTDDARSLCSSTKGRKRRDSSTTIPTLQTYYEDEYKPAYVLTHKSSAALYSISAPLKEFGDCRLDTISAGDVRAWMLARRRRGLAPATVNRQKDALSACLATAIPNYLSDNRVRDVKSMRIDQENRVRYLTDAEETSLREALDQRETDLRQKRLNHNRWRIARDYQPLQDLRNQPFADYLKPMVVLSINTGLRQGELFSLEWRNVTPQAVTVIATAAKSRKSRSIPLNAEAQTTIQSWREQTDTDGYVFKGRTGKFDNVRRSWKSVLATALIADFRWHDLRHHFASKLVMKGVPLNTVRELLGHSSLAMTMRYAHLAPSHLKEAVDLLSPPDQAADGI